MVGCLDARVLPSGVPDEKRFSFEGTDRSWEADLQAFEGAAAAGETTLERDWEISAAMAGVRDSIAVETRLP